MEIDKLIPPLEDDEILGIGTREARRNFRKDHPDLYPAAIRIPGRRDVYSESEAYACQHKIKEKYRAQ